MGKPSAPPPPDYKAAAEAQGASSLQAAQYAAGVARPNEITPTGSKTWTLRPGADPKNPQPGDYISTTTYSPEQQQIYEQGTALSRGLLNTAQGGLGRVDEMMGTPFDTSSAGAIRYSPDAPALRTNVDLSGVPRAPTDAAGTRDAVTNAIIARSMPELNRQAEARRTAAIVSGSDVGSEGYDRTEMANERAKNDLILGAIAQGSDAAQREIASQLALRQQGVGEQFQGANFTNTAAGQQFAQGLQSAGFDNAQRIQLLQELLAQRQLPLNEINALRSGNQVSLPQFTSGGANAGSPGATPYFDAAQAQAQYNNALYGTEMAGYNQTLGTAGTLAVLAYMY